MWRHRHRFQLYNSLHVIDSVHRTSSTLYYSGNAGSVTKQYSGNEGCVFDLIEVSRQLHEPTFNQQITNSCGIVG